MMHPRSIQIDITVSLFVLLTTLYPFFLRIFQFCQKPTLSRIIGQTNHCIAIHRPAARTLRKNTWMFFVKNISGINSASKAAKEIFIALTSTGVGPRVNIESQ